MSGVRYVVMRCHSCRWTWESLIAGSDTDLEPCPNCDSSDVSVERDRRPDAPLGHETNTPESRDSQHVLKAEAARPDATDRENPGMASPVGGPMGAGQPAAAGPLDDWDFVVEWSKRRQSHAGDRLDPLIEQALLYIERRIGKSDAEVTGVMREAMRGLVAASPVALAAQHDDSAAVKLLKRIECNPANMTHDTLLRQDVRRFLSSALDVQEVPRG